MKKFFICGIVLIGSVLLAILSEFLEPPLADVISLRGLAILGLLVSSAFMGLGSLELHVKSIDDDSGDDDDQGPDDDLPIFPRPLRPGEYSLPDLDRRPVSNPRT